MEVGVDVLSVLPEKTFVSLAERAIKLGREGWATFDVVMISSELRIGWAHPGPPPPLYADSFGFDGILGTRHCHYCHSSCI